MRRGMRNVLGASTAALCLGGLLAACGSEDGDGYVATGPAAASPERAPGQGVAPTGDVEFVPLDEPGGGKGENSGTPEGSGTSGTPERNGGSGGSQGDNSSDGKPSGRTASGSPTTPESAAPANGSDNSERTDGDSAPPTTPSSSAPPSGPAKLSVSAPERKPADDRWCEKVTVTFRNTGESPVRSGTVTFATHVIGALGVDWATIKSTEKLPALDAGQRLEKTWPVCVDPWRVPLGMHIETRDVSVKWK
ncbi:hypothetical protein [Streptomyces sp. BA2]|uniref:hypothetical protein n=1 Tax=Streptomyces sp. BA2 TaxID=436595 RepID=UPI00132626C0|nr:hypothetical protein [Streptomyces sp. BA2]MWA12196.1 hypothetical protein [Streptomyces sp. BA2]